MATRVEVVRAALGHLRWSVNHLEQGGLIKAERVDGDEVCAEFSWWPPAEQSE